jgi:hypothetical protein
MQQLHAQSIYALPGSQASNSSSANVNTSQIDWKAVEDAEYDRAVLISEEERDVEALRKRDRITILTNDCTLSLSTAYEFNASLLLGNAALATSKNIWCGSNYLQALLQHIERRHSSSHAIFLIDDDGPSNSSSSAVGYSSCEGVCNCAIEMKYIRAIIARLLLLEKDAMRFYAAVSYPYLQLLAEDLDEKFSLILISYGCMSASTSSAEAVPATDVPPAKKGSHLAY